MLFQKTYEKLTKSNFYVWAHYHISDFMQMLVMGLICLLPSDYDLMKVAIISFVFVQLVGLANEASQRNDKHFTVKDMAQDIAMNVYGALRGAITFLFLGGYTL